MAGLLQDLRDRAEQLENTGDAEIAVGGVTVAGIRAEPVPYQHGVL